MADPKKPGSKNVSRTRQLLLLWCPAILISFAALAAAPWLLGPRCPQHIVIATGDQNGAYFAFANRYRDILATKGITLEIRSTAGSVENEQLLSSDESGVSLALIQGGTTPHSADAQLQSLASLYQEPVWVFCRSDQPVDQLSQLRGKRIAVGREGSGTRAIAIKLLAENQIEDDQTDLVSDNAIQATQKLKSGEIDAAFIVISPESPIVRELLETEGIRLVNFRRAAAYQQKYPYLSTATLPEGLIDFHADIPDRDIQLLAPTANLVARKDLHHALVPLILQAVEEVHQPGGLLVQSESFPTPHFTDYPLNQDADRYFRSGPSFLYRYLPFWVAAWLDRVKLILLPMCTLLIPLLKAAPPIYRWRIRSKIYRWYRDLHEVDQELKDDNENLDVARCMSRLKSIEQELFEVSVPLSYMEEFYNLRAHLAFVQEKLCEHKQSAEYPRMVA